MTTIFCHIGFQQRPNHQVGLSDGRRAEFLPSEVAIVYHWLRIEGYLGNVGLMSSDPRVFGVAYFPSALKLTLRNTKGGNDQTVDCEVV